MLIAWLNLSPPKVWGSTCIWTKGRQKWCTDTNHNQLHHGLQLWKGANSLYFFCNCAKEQPERVHVNACLQSLYHQKGFQSILLNFCFWYTSCLSNCHFCVVASRVILMGLELNCLRSCIRSQASPPITSLDSTAHPESLYKQKRLLQVQIISQYGKEWQCLVYRGNATLCIEAVLVGKALSHGMFKCSVLPTCRQLLQGLASGT